MSKIRLVIFDLDGTLINSIDDIGNSMNKALTEFSLPNHEIEDYKLFVGTGARNLTMHALPEKYRQDDAFVDKVFARYREIYKNESLLLTAPYPGIPELLSELEKRKIPAAILSNKPHDDTVFLAKVLFPEFSFSAVYGQRKGVREKPDPAGALLIAEKLSVLPEHCLYVGDSGVDMMTGKAAKMLTVGVLWGFRGEMELRDSGADAIVATPQEIINLISETYTNLK